MQYAAGISIGKIGKADGARYTTVWPRCSDI
jgi:hypothetical protein